MLLQYIVAAMIVALIGIVVSFIRRKLGISCTILKMTIL